MSEDAAWLSHAVPIYGDDLEASASTDSNDFVLMLRVCGNTPSRVATNLLVLSTSNTPPAWLRLLKQLLFYDAQRRVH